MANNNTVNYERHDHERQKTKQKQRYDNDECGFLEVAELQIEKQPFFGLRSVEPGFICHLLTAHCSLLTLFNSFVNGGVRTLFQAEACDFVTLDSESDDESAKLDWSKRSFVDRHHY